MGPQGARTPTNVPELSIPKTDAKHIPRGEHRCSIATIEMLGLESVSGFFLARFLPHGKMLNDARKR